MNHNIFGLYNYRIFKAENCLYDAKLLLSMNRYDAAANRSYYTIFHAARALSSLEGKDFKKHSGVISNFNKDYVKTNIFDKKISEIILKAFDIFQESDYEDFYIISHEEVERQVQNAELFLNNIKFYINKQLNDE